MNEKTEINPKGCGRAETKFSFDNFLEHISDGWSISKTCKYVGISEKTFYKILDNEEDKKQDYEKARESRGGKCIDRIEEVTQDLKDGKIDSKVARVLIDTDKWLACKFYPKMYGDRTTVENKYPEGHPISKGLTPVLERISDILEEKLK